MGYSAQVKGIRQDAFPTFGRIGSLKVGSTGSIALGQDANLTLEGM